jgi:hypothetical protein
MALAAMKKEPSLRGRGLAITGLTIGYVLTLIYAGIIGSYIVLEPELLQQAEQDQLKAQISGPNLPTTTVFHAPPPAPKPVPIPVPAVGPVVAVDPPLHSES